VEIAGVVFAGEIKGVDCSGRAYEESLDAEAGVVDGAGRRREVEDEVNFAGVEGLGDVMFDQAETALPLQVAEIGEIAGAEIVDTDYRVSCGEQSVTQMGAEKSRCPGDKDVSRHHVTTFLLLKTSVI
jgi:hypothetical protein